MARFCSLFSSSSGNCTYIGSSSGGVLIDAGVSARQISLKLSGIGVSEKDIGAVFVTHEHSDHVKGLRVFASKYNIPVYATEGTIRELEKTGIINGKFPVFPIGSGIECNGQLVVPFRTSHHNERRQKNMRCDGYGNRHRRDESGSHGLRSCAC